MSALSIFALSYTAIALTFAASLIYAFLKDGTTPKSDSTSWLVIAVGSAFWAIALPISLIHRYGSSFSVSNRFSSIHPQQGHYSAL
ncbi:MAG: hypothetical protein VKK04_12065 [Synechococcales bacterium]|nr:hypothetical protein [Synechococcales bacterium]